MSFCNNEENLAALFPSASGSRPPAEHRFQACAYACAAVLNACHFVWDMKDKRPVRMIDQSKAPRVSQLMFVEQAYARNDARTRRLADISTDMSKAELAWICYQLVHTSSQGIPRDGPYDLCNLATKDTYHTRVIHSRADDPFGLKPLCAGGLVYRLYDAVYPAVREWASVVYAIVAAQVCGGAAPATPNEVAFLVERVTVHITCRAVCNSCGVHGDPLASAALEQLAAQYVEEELITCENALLAAAETIVPVGVDPRWVVAMQRVQSDKADVKWLAMLAKSTTLVEVNNVLRVGAAALKRVGAAPPPELRLAPSWAKCSTGTLASIVDDARDFEMRVELAMRWINEGYSAYALAACHEAHDRMEKWKPMTTPYIETITLRADGDGTGEFPRLPHTPQRGQYTLARLRSNFCERSGLSEKNERAVRFVSVVQFLAAHGEMPHGQLNAGIVCDVSMECLSESMIVYRLLHEQIMHEGLFVGPTLHATTDEIMESDGQFAAEVGAASHAVCYQTTAELFEPLQVTDDHAMETLTAEIGRRLRPLLDEPPDEDNVIKLRASIKDKENAILRVRGAVPPEMRQSLADEQRLLKHILCMPPAFVFDAYALAVSAVAKLRFRMRVPSMSPIHPIVSGLVNCPLVRAWTPSAGPLVLDKKEIAKLPADTRHWLLSIADQRVGRGQRAGFALCTRRHDKGLCSQLVLTDPYTLMRLVVHCAFQKP